jgi:hypothetical protein
VGDSITPELAYRNLEHGFICMDELGKSDAEMAELRRLAAQYLPPEHREAIAERLGCADLPAWLWHHGRSTIPPGPPHGLLHIRCDCDRPVILPITPIAIGGATYWAGWCGATDDRGCGKVWWTRREATQEGGGGGRITRETRWGGPPLAPMSDQSQILGNLNPMLPIRRSRFRR